MIMMRHRVHITQYHVARRQLCTSSVIFQQKLQKSSEVLTSATREHLSQKLKLKPKIGVIESFKNWAEIIYNSEANLQRKQDRLLKFALGDYYHGTDSVAFNSDGPLRAINHKTVIDDRGNFMNEILIENGKNAPLSDTEEKTNNLVMVHGYAAALGGFYKNIDPLIRNQDSTRIFALDWLGFGLSSRPELDTSSNDPGTKEFDISFDQTTLQSAKHVHSSLKLPESYSISKADLLKYNIENNHKVIEQVESHYIDALENWRKVKGLDNFTLLGHSLGGYLSIAYALKYPHRVSKLILVSPGGVERSPFAITNPIFQNEKELIKSEESDQVTFTPSMSPDSYDFLGRYPILSDYYKKLWNYEISPFVLLRAIGPVSYPLFYSNMFRKLSRNLHKFSGLEEVKCFIDYSYNLVMRKSNLEYLMMKIFASNVVGKYPMYDRIQDLKVNKTFWLFGEFDFMYNSIGDLCAKKLRKHGKDSSFKIIPKSGHNLYLDNYDFYNNELKKILNWK